METEEYTSGSKSVDLSYLMTVLPDDHVNRALLRACERLELAVKERRKSYSAQVEVLMTVLENLMTDCLTRISPEISSILFDYLLKHTLLLIFHGNWGEHKAVQSHMQALFIRFKIRARIKKLNIVVDKIEYLLELLRGDPWGNDVLVKIFNCVNLPNDQLINFVKKEIGIFLSTRIEVLIYAHCEIQAITLIEKCLDCVDSTVVSGGYFQNYFNEITYLRDLYLLLLNKATTNSYVRAKMSNEVTKLSLEECLQFVNRCRNRELPFHLLSKRTADVILSMALAFALTKVDTNEVILLKVMNLCFDSPTNRQVLLKFMNMVIRNAVCSRYIYCLGKVLTDRFNLTEKELCVETYIRALTLNVNEVERFKANDDEDKIKQHKAQLSNGFIQLGEYLKEDVLLSRECVLTAFSLDPSQSCFEKVKAFVEISSKPQLECPENESLLINRGRLPPFEAATTEHCQLDPPPPVLREEVKDKYNMLNIGKCFSEGLPPILTPERSLPEMHDNEYEHFDGNSNLTDGFTADQTQGREGVKEAHIEEIPDGTSVRRSMQLKYTKVFDAEAVGISQTLFDDLSSLVSWGRNQDLTWDLEWSELLSRCKTYILQKKMVKSVEKVLDSKNFNSETKGNPMELSCESEGNQMELSCDNTVNKTDYTFDVHLATPRKTSKRKRKLPKIYQQQELVFF